MPVSTVAEAVEPEAATKTLDLQIAVSPLRRVRHRFASAGDPKGPYNPTNPNDSTQSGDPKPRGPANDD